MMYRYDNRIVITLDAGGNKLNFGAIRSNQQIVQPIEIQTNPNDLRLLMEGLVSGFKKIMEIIPEKAVAISFAFPGPADYPNGMFPMALTNFPAFEGGIALTDSLKEYFDLPIFINNDADLFVYGEALAGMLPSVNQRLREKGSIKQYKNLLGFTFGTGFGFGLTVNKNMYIGDNCCSEVYCLPHKKYPQFIVEEGVSVRAILNYYKHFSRDTRAAEYSDTKDIYLIAEGETSGDRQVAIDAFAMLGEVAGYTISQAVTMLDGLVVIGGGIANAHKYIFPSLLKELRAETSTYSGMNLHRVPSRVYNLNDADEFVQFAAVKPIELPVFGTNRKVQCDSEKRIGIATTELGTSRATSIGAYSFALYNIDNK